jgi:hypothetical protein
LGGILAGPVIGGALFAISPAGALAFDAATFAVAMGFVYSLRGNFRHVRQATGRSLAGSVVDGVRWIATHRLFRWIYVLFSGVHLSASILLPVVPLFCKTVLGVGPVGYGAITAAGGLGAALSAMSVPVISAMIGRQWLVRVAVTGTTVALAAGAAASSAVGGASAIAFFWASATAFQVASVSLLQRLAPREILGRLSSCLALVSSGIGPVGAIIGTTLAVQYGLRAPFFASTALMASIGAVALSRMRWGRHRSR